MLALLASAPAAAAAAEARFVGQVTDTLRTPARRLLAGADGRALADLVFVDRKRSRTVYRTCVKRRGGQPLRTCFKARTGGTGAATVTPLRFRPGSYAVIWSVAGTVVARWRFHVV